MIRDFVTILYGEEVVIILVTAAFIMGLSIGYFLSLKFSDKFFYNSFLAIVFLHLTFPFSYRILAAEIARLHCSPWENGYNESFNGKLRDELLNGEIFYSLKEAKILIEIQYQKATYSLTSSGILLQKVRALGF